MINFIIADDLYIKRRDLQTAEEKLSAIQQSAAELGPTIRKSLSNPEVPMLSELEKVLSPLFLITFLLIAYLDKRRKPTFEVDIGKRTTEGGPNGQIIE